MKVSYPDNHLVALTQTANYGEGVKFLTVLTIIAYTFACYYWFGKKFIVKPFYTMVICPCLTMIEKNSFLDKHLSKLIWAAVITAIFVYSILITANDRYRLVSGAGVIGFIFFGYLMSEHRSRINWNQVLWGILLQYSLALFVLRTSFGRDIFSCIGDKITAFLSFTDEGSSFLFGYLVTGSLNGEAVPRQFAIFAFKVLPVILFFSFFVSILYYYGVMQVVVMKGGWLLQQTIGTTACESLNAAANIFLGMTEAPLIIKPYIPIMTKSELFAIMTGGFATIAGAVLAAYINFGVNATHLLSASVMAAPAALGFSKLFYPETEESRTQSENLCMEKGKEQNALEAAGNGASQAIKICSNIAGNLIAFLAFIKFLDTLCIWFGSNAGLDFVSFEWILSKLFVPIALMMGVEWEDSDKVAKLIGLKTLVNEFVAYTELSKQMGNLSERSIIISTYALCGFSNFSSIGITLGALGSLVPERKSDLAGIALKAMIAGSTVTFVSASMAGLLIDANQVILIDPVTNDTAVTAAFGLTTLETVR